VPEWVRAMAPSGSVDITCAVVGPLATNCYILGCPETREAIVVDPGGDADVIAARVKRDGLTPVEIVCTHGHGDHIAKVAELKREFGVGFAIHLSAHGIIEPSVIEAPLWGLGTIEEPAIDVTLSHGDSIRFGAVEGRVRHTPGHSPCSIAIVFDGFVLVGDTLFAGSVGRTDLLGGDFETLLASIRRELLSLPDETVVYCGHGPRTTIGTERRSNPFITGAF
jgi:hydroxyacylglutathione hydrolase